MRGLPLLAGAMLCCVSSLVSSCGGNSDAEIVEAIDPENFATMTSRDVSSLISDSGITRYRITAPLWVVYDEAKEPRWTFPEGLHIEKFDDNFKCDATIDCDSAVYFKDRQLWRLDGYVDIRNEIGEKFLTEQLFWDQQKHKVYSDSFIHIERADRIIEGYGFDSNERMTSFRVLSPSAILPVSQFTGKDDSSTADSLTAPADSIEIPTVDLPPAADRRGPRQRRSQSDAFSIDTLQTIETPENLTPLKKLR